jgi:hypothetical protein
VLLLGCVRTVECLPGAACDKPFAVDANDAATPSTVVLGLITPTSKGSYTATFSNGMYCDGPTEFASTLQQLCSSSHIVEQLSYEDPQTPTSIPGNAPLTVSVFGYRYDIRHIDMHDGFIGGCIKRSVPHHSYLCNRKPVDGGKSQHVFDLHTAKWKEATQTCYAYYLSPQERFGKFFCAVRCFDDNDPFDSPYSWLQPEFSQGLGQAFSSSDQFAPVAAAIVGGTLASWVTLALFAL